MRHNGFMFKPECNRLGPNPASDIPRPVILINQLIAVNLSFFVCIMRAFSSRVRALCPCHNLEILSRWLGLHTYTAEGLGSIPAVGTKIPQAIQHGQKSAGATEVHPKFQK